jgi:hypothetical protein
MSGLGTGRRARALVAVTIAGAAIAVVGVGTVPAGAVSVVPTCDAFSQDASTGGPTGAPLAEDVDLPALDIPSLGSGATVETGTAFEAIANGQSSTLPDATTIEFPAGSGTMLPANINEIKNITMKFSTSGAASLGTPTLEGGNVLGASASFAGTTMTFSLPGSNSGSTIPGGGAFFPGGGTLSTPKLTIPVTAPNSPGTITTSITAMTLMVKVTLPTLGGLSLGIYLDCTASGQIGSVNVIAPPPPPPGAPDAINDNAETNIGVAVTVAVLDNDVPDDEFAIDEDSLAITEEPTKGSVVVNADHTVTYTPNADETGVDSFRYEICSVDDVELQQEGACDVATVSVTINDPTVTPPTTLGTTPTSNGGGSASTAAAAADQLPVTGGSRAPLAALALGLVLLGAAALATVRRRVAP